MCCRRVKMKGKGKIKCELPENDMSLYGLLYRKDYMCCRWVNIKGKREIKCVLPENDMSLYGLL